MFIKTIDFISGSKYVACAFFLMWEQLNSVFKICNFICKEEEFKAYILLEQSNTDNPKQHIVFILVDVLLYQLLKLRTTLTSG